MPKGIITSPNGKTEDWLASIEINKIQKENIMTQATQIFSFPFFKVLSSLKGILKGPQGVVHMMVFQNYS